MAGDAREDAVGAGDGHGHVFRDHIRRVMQLSVGP